MDKELKDKKSKLHISVLCPGPVDTEFNKVANVEFALKGITAQDCVQYAIKKMFKNKVVIVPGSLMRLAVFGTKFISEKTAIKMAGKQQQKKLSK